MNKDVSTLKVNFLMIISILFWRVSNQKAVFSILDWFFTNWYDKGSWLFNDNFNATLKLFGSIVELPREKRKKLRTIEFYDSCYKVATAVLPGFSRGKVSIGLSWLLTYSFFWWVKSKSALIYKKLQNYRILTHLKFFCATRKIEPTVK